MPLYEFRCRSCGHQFEDLVAATAAVPPCPACAAPEPERLVSSFAFHGARGRSDFSAIPFDRGGCCGGACGHRHQSP